jgi:N-acyl-D-amino-acid deacylase
MHPGNDVGWRLPDGGGLELLIVGGTIVDGTGSPRRPGSVGVARGHDGHGRLVLIPPEVEIETRADRVLDATGKVVAPGFIDLHSHSGLILLAEPRHEPKVRQGVTTEIFGVDGLSYAPMRRREDLEAFAEMNAGLDGDPALAGDPSLARSADKPADHPSAGLTWRSVGEYLERFDRRVSLNVGMLVGNSALRLGVLGWDEPEADDRALGEMRSMLREGLADGAFGLSSGLDYPPGAYASTGELANLAHEAGRAGGIYHTHVRYALGDRFLDPFREAIEIGQRGDVASHITHFYHRATFPGTPEQMLALLDDARATGQDVTFDAYPYEWASSRLLITVPTWVQAGGPARTKERLADRAIRTRIRAEMGQRGVLYAGAGGLADIRLGYFGRPENLQWESRTLGDVSAALGLDLVDTLCDLLLAEDLRINQVTPGPHLEGIRRFYRHPMAMVGTDSTFVGAKPSPRTYGSYPRILGQFVRDEALLSLEAAIAKMTSLPADRLGLRDRGRVADGLAADLVVFDPATIRSNATYDEPRRFAEGIDHVLVDGTFVVDAGGHTGATPGRALRRGRD